MLKWFNEKNTSFLIEILSVLLLFFVAYLLFLNNARGLNSFDSGDVQRGFQRGLTVLNDQNPYLEFNPDQMLDQEKVPGFFPLYFYLMAFIAKISNYSFVIFLENLRLLVFFCYLGIGSIIYILLRERSKILALFGMIIFMFNRWTVSDVLSLKQDSYVILLLLISLLVLKNHRNFSFLIYGIATAIKHITIFALPIYFVEIITLFQNKKAKKTELLLSCILLVAPIIVPSIKYIKETPKNYFNAIIYNLTRSSEGVDNLNRGFDSMLILYNQDKNQSNFYYMLPRLPMLIAFIMLFLVLLTKKINIWQYCTLAYLVFIGFNPVLFGQYYTWFLAFMPLTFVDVKKSLEN